MQSGMSWSLAGAMRLDACSICNDTGMIDVPVQVTLRMIQRSRYEGERLERYQETVTDRTGGIDACPQCAARARAMWGQAIAE